MVNLENEDGYTMLNYASFYCRCDIVAFLLKNDANPNIPNKLDGNTPLHCAIN